MLKALSCFNPTTKIALQRSRTMARLDCYELTQMPLLWAYNGQPIDLNDSVVVNWKFKASDYFAETFQGLRSLYIAYYARLLKREDSLQELAIIPD